MDSTPGAQEGGGGLGVDRVVIRVTDDSGETSREGSVARAEAGAGGDVRCASEVVVGLLDSPRTRPVSDSGPPRPALPAPITKSASHVESLGGCSGAGRGGLRTSVTNGSLVPGRGHYVMDINQNPGGRKNRSSDKSNGTLAIQGTSKCCSLS